MAQAALQVENLIAGLVGTDGLPLQSGTVSFFETDGVTPKTIWEDSDKNTASANPVTLDVRGTAEIFADGVYSIVIKDSLGNTIKTIEKVTYDSNPSSDLIGVDASLFGSGDDSDAISQAISSVSGADSNIFLKNQKWTIDSNITIPSNINLLFEFGAHWNVLSGITGTINGTIQAPLFNIFQGPGTVTIDNTANPIIPTIWLQTAVAGNLNLHNIVQSVDELEVNVLSGIGSNSIEIDSNVDSTGTTITFESNVKMDRPNGTLILDSRSGSLDKTSDFTMIGAETDLGDAYARINFTNFDNDASQTEIIMVKLEAINDGDDKAALTLYTKNGGLLERLRIDNLGNVGIGTTSPNFQLDVSGDIRIEDANNLRFGGTGSGDSDISLTRSAASTLQIDGDFDLQSNDLLNVSTLSATNLSGTLTTGLQPNISDIGTGSVDIVGWNFAEAFSFFTFPVAGTLRTAATATTTGITLDHLALKMFESSTETLSLDRATGRITATESDITRNTIKITSTANVGTAINTAISTLGADGGVIYLPAGVYSLDATIVINQDNITIVGDGRDVTIIECDSALTRMIDQQVGDSFFTLRDLTLDGVAASTSQFCVDATGANTNLVVENCSLKDSTTSLISSSSSTEVTIKNSLFTVPINGVSINIDGGNWVVENNIFNASGTPSTAIQIEFGLKNVISNCEFNNFDNGISFSASTTDYTRIIGNYFNNCNTGIDSSVFIEQCYIIENFFNSGNTHAINLGRSETLQIAGNAIDSQAGTSCITIVAAINGIIQRNSIKDSSITKAFDIPNGTETTTNVPFTISDNIIDGVTCEVVIDCLTSAHSTDERQSIIITNNMILNCDGITEVIITGNPHSIVSSNILINITSLASSDLFGIQTFGTNCLCTNNILKDFTLTTASGFSIIAIQYQGAESIVSNNIINMSSLSDLSFSGISESGGGSNRSNVQGNVITMNNTGAGTGNAFSIGSPTPTDGVITGNTYAGSDAQGTLALTTGIIANNDG